MSDLRSSNIYDMLDEDGGASAAIQKKDAKSTPTEKPSNKKVDAPPKKEKPAKNEEPAAPLGKEQRGAGGRENKPRGRGRDNKGGLRRPAGSGREFDRRSGPSSSHRNPREGKRHGGGQHNWGDAVEEGTKAAQAPDETPASPPPPADENKTEAGATAATTENKEATEVKEPQEEEDKTLTFDQYLTKKKQQAPEGDKLEARQPDNDSFEGHSIIREVTSEKKNKKKPQQEEEDEKAEKSTRKKKNIVTLDEFNAHTQPAGGVVKAPREPRPPRTESAAAPAAGGAEPAARGGRGRGRGRGGPRGGRGRGGGRAQGPELTQEMFPKLGK